MCGRHRYNTFYVLYPLGILSEMRVVWLAATGPAKEGGGLVRWDYVLLLVLLLYVPGRHTPVSVGRGRGGADEVLTSGIGSYVLYTHMIAQRRKMMRGKRPERGYAS